jgi:hypothetical protein
MTTFWPDRSVETTPSASSVARPLRPVTMNASLGPATLIRRTKRFEDDENDAADDGDQHRSMVPSGRCGRVRVGDRRVNDGALIGTVC